MVDIILMGIVILLVGLAVSYIVKSKKNGVKCIGCPSGGICSGRKDHGGTCSCGCHGTEGAGGQHNA